jgi:hypothetical protein
MKLHFTLFAVFLSLLSFAQEEFVRPLLVNPNISPTVYQQRLGNTLDSTFIYNIDTLDLPVWDDFSISKFIPYTAGYTDGNVTSQLYYQLMNSTNTVPQNPALTFCNTDHAHHDTISMIGTVATTFTSYFPTPISVWVNDLTAFPVTGILTNLYEECYVLVDSIIDGVPDPDQDTIFYTASPDFVQDSARVFMVDYADPTKIWIDKYAYHNYTYAYQPWSLGVATLDGVDENGWPYDFGNTSAHESADVLTSRPINLAGKINVYLTFLYQAEGYGNAPEIDDSLLLEFWIVDSNRWMPSGWYSQMNPTPIDVWDTVHWQIPSAALDDGFRFRFRNWASTSGALDHWHIDYVNLKDNDLPTVSNFSDLAISEPIKTILDDYTSVPWDHFKNADASDKMIDTLKVRVYNSDLTPTNFANGGLEIRFENMLQGGSPYTLANPAITSEWTGNWELGLNKYPYPLQANYTFNDGVTAAPQAAFDIKLNIDAAVSGSNVYDVNDTTYYVQDFRNYYSYDDGSAEAAYGITGSHSLLAYKFEAYEEDTLTGVLMHFVPSVYDHSDELFLLTVWDDNAGQPGAIIYQDDYFNTQSPEYSGAMNGFRYYTFMANGKVAVPQTFYVGWEQIGSTSLNVGMDQNVANGDKIYRNVSGSWLTSAFSSSLLIRPVFSTGLNYTLSDEVLEEKVVETVSVNLYPNPVNQQLTIETNANYFSVTLYDITGRVVMTILNETQLDVSGLMNGIYIADIRDANGVSLYSGKLIKE